MEQTSESQHVKNLGNLLFDDFHFNSNLLKEGESPEKHNALKRSDETRKERCGVGAQGFLYPTFWGLWSGQASFSHQLLLPIQLPVSPDWDHWHNHRGHRLQLYLDSCHSVVAASEALTAFWSPLEQEWVKLGRQCMTISLGDSFSQH